MSIQKSFADGSGEGYMERHRRWLTQDDHVFLEVPAMTIYTSLPQHPDTEKYYRNCFPDVAELRIVCCTQDQLELLAQGEEI